MAGNKKIGPDDLNVVLKFGGGLHTQASPDEIDVHEAASGQNFLIDVQNRNLRPRPAFDLIGTVPNAASIQGGGSLLKTDGTVTALFQAGTVVYQWDGHTTFTSKGNVAVGTKLRGNWKSHVWNLTDELILTDLALADTVKKWNGTTFSNVTFTNQAGSGFGNFFAKYLDVSNERAVFANVKDGNGSFPHLIIGSARSDVTAGYTQITVTNRPTSAANDSDPFYLVAPDTKPINGVVEAFGTLIISTQKGQIFNLSGSTAKDFAFNPFYAGSAASGSESIVVIGNDTIFGRQGRLESLVDTNAFGNSVAADITVNIADVIQAYTGWTSVFNSRTRLLYEFPTGVSEVWVLDQAVKDAGSLSPWMRWKTDQTMGFQPTYVDSMLDPNDGLEYIFMGDSSGKIYRMEGTGTSGDAGTNNIDTQFQSKLLSGRLDAAVYEVEGYIKYTRNQAFTATLTFQYQGESIFNQQITVSMPAASTSAFYGGGAYYSGGFYYGTISGRLSRKKFMVSGQNNEFQVLVEVNGTATFSINEIGLRFRASTQ